MRKFEKFARFFALVAALCFALSIGTVTIVSASSQDAGHTATLEHATAGDTAHAEAADVHGEAADAHGGGHGEGSLSPAKLKDLLWRVLNFVVLIFLLVKFAAKPIGTALAGRQKKVKEELEDLEARRDAAEKSYKEFEAKLATVEKDIDSVVEKAVAQAEVEKKKDYRKGRTDCCGHQEAG